MTYEYDSEEERNPPPDPDAYFGKRTLAGIYGQDHVECVPFVTPKEEALHPLRKAKVELKGLLCSAGPLTAHEILAEIGNSLDSVLESNGFTAIEDLLRSMPDMILETIDGNGRVVYMAKENEKSADISSLIQRQQKCPVSPSKRSHRTPCSTGLPRNFPIPRSSATLLDTQPKYARCRVNWMAGTAPTKSIGSFPCPPKTVRRPLKGDGPRCEERCCMIVEMIREIGERSPDGTEVRSHIDNLKDYYYKETGLALLGKIYSIEEYAQELESPEFSKFWKIMREEIPGAGRYRIYVVVRSDGFYSPPVACPELPPRTSTPTGNNDVFEPIVNPFEPNVDKPSDENDSSSSPQRRTSPKIAQSGLRAIRFICQQNIRECKSRGDNKLCNRLPVSKEDLRSRQIAADSSNLSNMSMDRAVEDEVLKKDGLCVDLSQMHPLTESDVQWMKTAKVLEFVMESGVSKIIPLCFVPPSFVIATTLWGNESCDRFNFIGNELKSFAEKRMFVRVKKLSLGMECIVCSDSRFARAVFISPSADDLYSFILLDFHAVVRVALCDVFEIPSCLSAQCVPANTFLAEIRGIKNIPETLFEKIADEVKPKNGAIVGEIMDGELFYTKKNDLRLIDWIYPPGSDSWFSECCMREGAEKDEIAPKNRDIKAVREYIEFTGKNGDYDFFAELEEDFLQYRSANNVDSIVQELVRAVDHVEIGSHDVEAGDSVNAVSKIVRFDDNLVSYNYTRETEDTSPESDSSMVIHAEHESVSDQGSLYFQLCERVANLVLYFLISSQHTFSTGNHKVADISDFNIEFFRSLFPGEGDLERSLHKFLCTVCTFKTMWLEEPDQYALDEVEKKLKSWIDRN